MSRMDCVNTMTAENAVAVGFSQQSNFPCPHPHRGNQLGYILFQLPLTLLLQFLQAQSWLQQSLGVFFGYKQSMANLQTEMSSSAPGLPTSPDSSPTDGSETLNPSPGCPSQYLTPLPAATQQLPVLWIPS